jgi:hypothetical protein
MTCGRLSVYDTLLQRLTQHLPDMASAHRPCIPQAPPVVRPRHLSRLGEVLTADQPHSGDGVRGGATRAQGDHGSAGTGEAGDARDTRGLQRFGETHRRQNGGQSAR